MAKKKPKWVRLSNGQIEDDIRVGSILADLYGFATNHPAHFELVAKWVAQTGSVSLTEPVLVDLRRLKFLKTTEPPELWDDVKDVIECCSEWFGSRVRFNSKSLLNVDQSNIVPPEEDD